DNCNKEHSYSYGHNLVWLVDAICNRKRGRLASKDRPLSVQCYLPISHLTHKTHPVAYEPRAVRLHHIHQRSTLAMTCPEAVSVIYKMASNLFWDMKRFDDRSRSMMPTTANEKEL